MYYSEFQDPRYYTGFQDPVYPVLTEKLSMGFNKLHKDTGVPFHVGLSQVRVLHEHQNICMFQHGPNIEFKFLATAGLMDLVGKGNLYKDYLRSWHSATRYTPVLSFASEKNLYIGLCGLEKNRIYQIIFGMSSEKKMFAVNKIEPNGWNPRGKGKNAAKLAELKSFYGGEWKTQPSKTQLS